MKLPDDLLRAHYDRYGHLPAAVASAPGRVNLIGDHVDYNRGLALPAAIGARAWACATPIPGPMLHLEAVDLKESAVVDLGLLSGGPCSALELPAWACYPAGVVWSLMRDGVALPGLQCSIHSQVPIGSGLSSSAAIEVAVATMLLAVSGQARPPLELARLCQRAENDFVGVQSGLMDQWTAARAEAGCALLLDFRELTSRSISWPDSTTIVIAYSGVKRSLTDSLYNERVKQCHEALAMLQQSDAAVGSLRDLSTGHLDWARRVLPQVLFKRVRHVVTEIERVRSAAELLSTGNLAGFAELLIASHTSLRDDYEVSTPELDRLVSSAMQHPACRGARLTGAGFGGCTVQIVPGAEAEEFMQFLLERYAGQTDLTPELWAWRPGAGAATHTL